MDGNPNFASKLKKSVNYLSVYCSLLGGSMIDAPGKSGDNVKYSIPKISYAILGLSAPMDNVF